MKTAKRIFILSVFLLSSVVANAGGPKGSDGSMTAATKIELIGSLLKNNEINGGTATLLDDNISIILQSPASNNGDQTEEVVELLRRLKVSRDSHSGKIEFLNDIKEILGLE